MKKLIIACVVAMTALAFTSCDPNKTQCWKITLQYESGQTEEFYYWGSGVDSDAVIEQYAQTIPGTKATKQQTFLSKDNCHK